MQALRHKELRVHAGCSPSEAVAIFSSHGAQHLGRQNEIKRADLALLSGDFEHGLSFRRAPTQTLLEDCVWPANGCRPL